MASIGAVDALDVSALRLFLAVVELGSVSKAAARHRLAQPSATAKLQKLERQLGVQLLDRGPSGSAATAAGVRLAPACAELVAAAMSLVASGEELRDEQRRLVVATTDHVADHFLARWVGAAGLTGVVVDLHESDTRTVAQAVRSSEAALGFTTGPAAPLGLRSEVVATEELVAVVGREHRWYERSRPVSPRDVVDGPLVVGARGSGTLDVIEHALTSKGISSHGERIEVDGDAAIRLAAVNSLGVALLPRCRVADDLAAGRLREVTVRDMAVVQAVRVVWRGARPSERPARQLLDAARRRVAE